MNPKAPPLPQEEDSDVVTGERQLEAPATGRRPVVAHGVVEPSGFRPVGNARAVLSGEVIAIHSMGLGPGSKIAGKYELVRRLGEGGMGTVWAAHNSALDIEVALKVIRQEMVTPVLAERLLVEARSAAKLKHPAIVQMLDFGTTPSGVPYLVMELLKGEGISERFRRVGVFEPEVALQIMLPIAHGLEAAHRRSVVHRDLKPENVFLAEIDGGIQPKLFDFGVARVERPGRERLTSAGVAVGSPCYMSPEQAQGIDVDARSDVWSFCVVLYELMTGSPPFNHTNHNALMQRIINFDPEPLSGRGVSEPGLWPILDRGFAKCRERRWQTMRDLGRELAMWLLARGVTEDITGRSLRSAWLDGDSWEANLLSEPDPSPEREIAPELPKVVVEQKAPRSWLRASMMLAAVVAVGGSAGWLLSTHQSRSVSMNAPLRVGAARLSNIATSRLAAASLRGAAATSSASPVSTETTVSRSAASALASGARSGESAAPELQGVSHQAATTTKRGRASAGEKSTSVAAPKRKPVSAPGSDLEIKTEF